MYSAQIRTISPPHSIVIRVRKYLGPMRRQTTVAGGWKRMYVVKKTRATRDYGMLQYSCTDQVISGERHT